jgi:hypothetical protein
LYHPSCFSFLTTASFSLKPDAALGRALAVVGPGPLLSVLPLNIDISSAPPNRYWLLPLMKHHISHAPLLFFSQNLVPMAQGQAKRASELLASAGPRPSNSILQEVKTCKVLYDQIWDLFPQFCIFPPDIPESFKTIAKNLGTSLEKEAELRLPICSGLVNLIEKNKTVIELAGQGQEGGGRGQEQSRLITPEQAKINLAAIAGESFFVSLLPHLFSPHLSSSFQCFLRIFSLVSSTFSWNPPLLSVIVIFFNKPSLLTFPFPILLSSTPSSRT